MGPTLPISASAPREPMKTNVFDLARVANSTWVPLFPYLDEGCIVPALSNFHDEPGRVFGEFQHTNTAEEIGICFGSHQAGLRPGHVLSGPHDRHVHVHFGRRSEGKGYALVVVTQRQADAGQPQEQALTLLCSQCQAPLLRHRFDARPTRDARQTYGGGPSTVIEHSKASRMFNACPSRRTCPCCGHVNAPFEVQAWGWDRYEEQSRIAEQARQSLAASAPT